MMRSFYTAATGMMAQQLNMDTITNNLANVNTTGYKKARVDFQDLLYATMREPGFQSAMGQEIPMGSQVGLGVRSSSTQKLYTVGSLSETRNKLDAAINGDGFFQVTVQDGTRAFTRDGSFKMDGQGRLVTQNGYQTGITIPDNVTNIFIKDDGSIMGTRIDQLEPSKIGQLKLSRFLNPSGLKAIGGNMYQETPGSGVRSEGNPGQNGLGLLAPGFLEKSNVNVVEEMVSIVQAQRAYEINQKGVQAADEMMRMTNQLHKG
ncbi:MAG: flagellar basal-body rod protein FlgG [Armatimonadetes bacterium]|nr:flagellar basal-body rod protein FlgG [Armatimonadota bacterium]